MKTIEKNFEKKHWKAIKESNFTHINRKKRQTLHTYTYTWRKTETL